MDYLNVSKVGLALWHLNPKHI